MRLAPDDIEISIGNMSIELRPSLRAALRLARRYDGFAPLFRGVLDGNLTIIAEVIREGSTAPTAVPDLLIEIGTKGLGISLENLIAPLVDFVLALTGHDATAANDRVASTADPVPFTVYFEGLFRAATGVMGWSPAVAWAATPAEIQAAYEGRASLLKSIFGSADTPAEDHARDPNAKLDREAFNALKAEMAR
jgi:hypothetical protein